MVHLNGASSAISAPILAAANITNLPTSNTLITFTQDSNGVIKSCFNGIGTE